MTAALNELRAALDQLFVTGHVHPSGITVCKMWLEEAYRSTGNPRHVVQLMERIEKRIDSELSFADAILETVVV